MDVRGAVVRPAAVGRRRLSFASASDLFGPAGRLVAGLAVAAALIPVALYVWAAAHRIGYGYDFDWLEGGAVELVARVLHGKSLYAPPSLAYVPYTYPPLYSWVSAAVAVVTGVGYLPLRIVSFGASLLSFTALARLVLRATGDRAAAVVAVGLFAATYGLTGWWFDVGRVDSLFLALTLAALWVGRDVQTVQGGMVFGLLAFLAFFTKQTALVAVAPAVALTVVTRPRAGVAAVVTLGVLGLASTLALDATTGGWYRYYISSELAGQPWVPKEELWFWQKDLYRHLRPVALLLVLAVLAAAAAAAWRMRPGVRPARSVQRLRSLQAVPYGYEVAVAAGLLAAAWLSRVHTGGFLNVLMPGYAGVALLAAVAFADLRRRGLPATVIAALLVIVQMTGLLGTFTGAIPTRAQSAEGHDMIAALRALPGPVLVLAHPWYGTLAGKGSFAQQDAILEVLRSNGPRGSAYLRRNLDGALDRYGIRAVVLDGGAVPNWLVPELDREFVRRQAPLTRDPLRGYGGVPSAPELVYLRRAGG